MLTLKYKMFGGVLFFFFSMIRNDKGKNNLMGETVVGSSVPILHSLLVE